MKTTEGPMKTTEGPMNITEGPIKTIQTIKPLQRSLRQTDSEWAEG